MLLSLIGVVVEGLEVSRRQAVVVAGAASLVVPPCGATIDVAVPGAKDTVRGVVLRNGLRYTDTNLGTGVEPKWGDMLRISYVQFVRVGETLEPIDEIDSFIVRHGNGRTIRGLDEGIHTMRVGGVRRVEVPPQLGYNIVGLGPLPEGPLKRRKLAKNLDKPGATVVFDVALLETWKDAADLGFYDDSTYTADQMDFILKKAKLASQGLVG